MNAPWNPGRRPGVGTRDPFIAFVCDDATVEIARAAATDMGWPGEKIYRGGLRNAVQTLSVSASPSVLFVDLSETGDPLNDINALAEVCEPGTVVIATGGVNDVRLYRDLLASGIHDYVLKPLSPELLRESFLGAQTALAGPRVAEPDKTRPRLLTAVIGARGGVGASAVASSLAWMLGAESGRSTGLFDLDVHFGTGAMAFDLEPGRGLTDALDNPSRVDALFIERAMVRVNDNLAVLSSEAAISHPVLMDGQAVHQLQEEMRSSFDCVVVDLPRNVMIQHPHLLVETQTILVVTELTLVGARDTIRMLAWLKTNAPGSKVVVIANKAPVGAGEVARKDFESSIERPVDLLLPYDPKVATQAAKLGKCLAEVAKGSKLGQAMAPLPRLLLDHDGDGHGDEAVAGKSLLGNIKALLPAKGKALRK
jgi:pilus assembly protein CpaE